MKNIDKITKLVNSIDLEPIVYTLVCREDGPKWSLNKAKLVEQWYRQFLILSSVKPDTQIIPTKSIDIFWHTHILDTKKYMRDCDTIFNGYFHHFPYLGLRSKKDAEAASKAFHETLSLFEQYFQKLPYDEYARCGDSCGFDGISPCGNKKKKDDDDNDEATSYVANKQTERPKLPGYH